MKLSYNLLKQYVALPNDLTMEQLAYDLTMRTVEVEGTTNLAEQYEHIVAGKILSVAPHPAVSYTHLTLPTTPYV